MKIFIKGNVINLPLMERKIVINIKGLTKAQTEQTI